MTKPMVIFAFDYAGPAHLSAGLWRHPADRGEEYKDLNYWVEYAKLLERSGFDGIFWADNIGYHNSYRGGVDESLKDAAQIPVNDPAYLIPAMAAVTNRIGFGVTSSTAYDQPYPIARKFSTLDHLTRGRVGWNVVTSYSDIAAQNHSLGKQRAHDDRYAQAEEFIEVCLKLWEGSWEDDAVVIDRENGVYVDPAKVHPIGHSGADYSVPGIHLSEPSPQRTPVIFQAGGSSRGVKLAGQSAEAVFLNATTKSGLKAQVEKLRDAAREAGRDPEGIRTLQMITVISAATDEEAQQKYEEYLRYVSYEGAMARYSGWTGVDMSQLDPDVPLKDVQAEGTQTMLNVFLKMDPDKVWTPRAIAEYVGIGGTSPVIVGGPQTVADELEAWIDETGVSGYNLANAVKYQDVKDFCDFVVPELQRRGHMDPERQPQTLRESLFGAGQSRVPDDHPAAKFRR